MYGEGTEVRVYWDIGCFAFRHLNAFELSGREESMLSICVICFALSLSQASFLSLLGPSSSSSCFIFVLTILFSPQVHTLPDAIFRTLGKTSFLHTYIHHTENSCGPVSFSWYIQFILARSALPINIPPLALVVRLSSFLATSALTAIPYEREYPPTLFRLSWFGLSASWFTIKVRYWFVGMKCSLASDAAGMLGHFLVSPLLYDHDIPGTRVCPCSFNQRRTVQLEPRTKIHVQRSTRVNHSFLHGSFSLRTVSNKLLRVTSLCSGSIAPASGPWTTGRRNSTFRRLWLLAVLGICNTMEICNTFKMYRNLQLI